MGSVVGYVGDSVVGMVGGSVGGSVVGSVVVSVVGCVVYCSVEAVVSNVEVVNVVEVDEVSTPASPERHCVTMSIPPPVFTSQPCQFERGHCVYFSFSLTIMPLYGHLGLGDINQDTQILAGYGVRVIL